MAAAGLVCGAATVVLVFEVLSLFDALTTGGILAGQLVVALAAAGAWVARGRPRPPLPARPSRHRLIAEARAHPAVAGLVAVLGAALVLQLVMGVAVLPNTWDSMTYHLSRGAYWLQQDAVGWFDGGHARQVANPPVGEMLQTWTLALAGTDRLTAVIQWLALLGLLAVVYSGARMLGFRPAPSLFAAAVFALMPQPLLQSSTTQNDLILAFFLGAGVLFAVRGLRDATPGDLAIGGVALGLAVGTKGTALAAGPSVALLLGGAIHAWRPSRRIVATGAGAIAAGVVAFGAYGYAVNYAESDDVFGGLTPQHERTSPVPDNLARLSWTFADSPALSSFPLDIATGKAARNTIGELRRPDFEFKVNTTVSEDSARFGLVGFLIFIPLLLYVAAAPRQPGAQRLVALASLLYLLTFAITAEYNAFSARLLMGIVALGAPLLAVVAVRPSLRAVATLLALVSAAPALFVNPNKPLLTPPGRPTVFSLDGLSQQTIVRPEMAGVMREVARRVGPEEPLGFTGSGDAWDYPLFGRDLERRVEAIPFGELTNERIWRERVAGVLVSNFPRLPPGIAGERLARGYWFVPAP